MEKRSDCRMPRSLYIGLKALVDLPILMVTLGCTRSGTSLTPLPLSDTLSDTLLPLRIFLALGSFWLLATVIVFIWLRITLARRRREEDELQLHNTILTLQPQTCLDDIVTVDSEGTVIFRNCRYGDLWGDVPSQPEPLSFQEVIQPLLSKIAEPVPFLQLVHQVCGHHEERREEIVLKGGRVLELYTAPLRGGGGDCLGRVWYLRYVTARKRAQRALEESEAKFRGLVEAAADGIVMVNARQEIVMVNEQFEMMFGYPRSEVVGRNIAILVPPRFTRHSEYVRDYINNPRKRLMGHGLELVALRKDGSEFPVEIGLSPLETPQGLLVTAAIRDITYRKSADRQLAAAASYNHSLLEASPDALFSVNRRGAIIGVNEATVKLTGMARQELIGADFSSRFTPAEAAREAYRLVFDKGVVRDLTLGVVAPSGASTEVVVNAAVFRDEGGEVQGMFAAARDMRERLRVEAQLREVNAALELRVTERSADLLRQSREILQAADIIGRISGEITTATIQVLDSAVRTASAINQTTAAVEEVRQTALLANERAGRMNLAAQNSFVVAQGGKKAVQASIDGMRSIRDHVASSAESMVRLSRQGRAIGEIISTVNDLAEESNVLAMNAAIEAVKAGEQGRGFAVVAHEVKNLAQRSKESTAQVRAILGDIREATDQAVLLTEQGIEAARVGMEQAITAGGAINSMEEEIAQSTQAALLIAASCQQQLAGMAQVARAMESIQEASAHNVIGMQQVQATLQHLRELGEKLKLLDARIDGTG